MKPGYGNDYPQKRVPIRRPRKACTICRGLKTRCLPDGENKDPKSRCSRCARLNLVCEYSRVRRGRKNSDNEPASPPSGSPMDGSHLQRFSTNTGIGGQRGKWELVPPYDRSLTDSRILSGMGDKGMPWSQHRDTMLSMNTEEVSPPELYPASNGSTDTNLSPLTTYGLIPGKASTSFLDYLEPPLSMLDGPQASLGRSNPSHAEAPAPDAFRAVYSDPIEVGYLTEPEARHLFNQFMLRIAPSSTFFDPHYHTLERVRTSSTLFTAILYAAALFLRPEIAGQLHSLAENHIARKMHGGDYDLALIQAILVLVYWKHPNDRTTYQKMGMAVRLVAELRLQQVNNPARPTPAAITEEEERRRVDIERTAQNAIGLDIVISFVFQLPPALTSSMPPAEQVLAWAESHSHLDIPGDFLSAFTAGLWEAHSTFGGHPRLLIEGTPHKYTLEGYTVLSRRLDEHMARFRNHHMLVQEPYYSLGQLMGKSAVLKVRTVGWLQHLSPSTTASTIIALCEDFLVVIKRLAATGDILFCSDTILSLISLPGILLHLGCKNFNPDERRRCASFMVQLANIAGSLTGNPGGEHTMVFIERFYRRLGQEFDRRFDGEVSSSMPLQSSIQYQWPGLNTAIPNSVPDTLGVTTNENSMEPPVEWTWSNMLNSIPSWEGGIVP